MNNRKISNRELITRNVGTFPHESVALRDVNTESASTASLASLVGVSFKSARNFSTADTTEISNSILWTLNECASPEDEATASQKKVA